MQHCRLQWHRLQRSRQALVLLRPSAKAIPPRYGYTVCMHALYACMRCMHACAVCMHALYASMRCMHVHVLNASHRGMATLDEA